jgi:hypothetical protein
MIDRSHASLTRTVIPQIHCVATDIYLPSTVSNTARKRQQSTADCTHARLGTTASPGYLAALRDARLHVARLDDIQSPLQIFANRLFGEGSNTVYECRVSAGDLLLANGRITIMQRT